MALFLLAKIKIRDMMRSSETGGMFLKQAQQKKKGGVYLEKNI
jgi:hypothetical protein